MEWVYCEDNKSAMDFREEYEASLDRLVSRRRHQTDENRTVYAKKLLENPEACRKEFVAMLGWPLTEYIPHQPCTVKTTPLYQDDEMTITRVQLEVRKDFWFGGLLFLHTDEQKRPFVLTQHGGAGTPELCSGLLEMGSANYNGMTRRAFEKGANVFAPQLFLWDTELFGCRPEQQGKTRDEIRRSLDISLKNLGSSIMAVELYCLRRCVDYFEKQPYVSAQAIGMMGLSYGGQYALLLPAVEPRIAASLSSCFFNDRHHLEWSDFTWFDAANRFMDAEIALLTRPRKLFLQVADQDPVFPVKDAVKEWERLKALCSEDLNWVNFRAFEGEHEFDKDDGQMNALLQELRQRLQ